MNKAYISIGSNLGNRLENLNKSIQLLQTTSGIAKQMSSIYETPSWGYQSFNNFLNQVVALETLLEPQELMRKLLEIEENMGRVRLSSQYQDRIIDLDIIDYNNEVMRTKHLQLPHPRYHERAFVVWPLAEIAPNLIHPILLKSAEELKNAFQFSEIKLYQK